MGSSILPTIAALIGTFAGIATTYLVAKHRSSGKIATSEAADLWAASESIRHDLSEDVKSLRSENASLRAEVATLRAEIVAIRHKMEA